MLDGEVVQFEIQQRRKRTMLVGPCPACYDRARRVTFVEEAIERARREFPLGVDECKILAITGVLTMDDVVVHAGCFRGRVVLDGWETRR